MIRKVSLIILISIILLAIVSCDRFDKPTGNTNGGNIDKEVSQFFTDLDNIARVTSPDNISDFLAFFHADYLNNGVNKQEIADLINSIFLVNEAPSLKVNLTSNNNLYVEWKLLVLDSENTTVNEYVYNDVLITESGEYFLYGNQESASTEEKLMLFAEIMTATWCGTCPNVESAMHDYQSANPDRFFYLEYHVLDSIAGEHQYFDTFYGQVNPPVAILQGQDIFAGDYSSTYPTILNQYKEMEAQFKLSNLNQTDVSEMYQAQLDIEVITEEVPRVENLILRWAFYEEISPVNNYAGQACRHVVLTEGYYNINQEDINSSYSVNIDYPRDLPDDLGIVFWLQTANENHDDDSFIHAWVKEDVRR